MTAAAVASFLGGTTVLGRAVHTDLELATEVKRGLPSASLAHIVQEFRPVLSMRSIYAVVGGSERTLQRKQQNGQRLSRVESERLARVARLAVRAQEALGDKDTAYHWLVTPNRALEGRQPLEMLDTDAGARVVEEVLERIERGVYG